MSMDRDEKLFRERGFNGRMGFGESPALVIIDMQKGLQGACEDEECPTQEGRVEGLMTR